MEQTVQKQRVAVYCRVATDSEDHFASLAVQEAYYTEMVGQHPEWELAGIYADRGIAGADRQNQKEFKRMLTACKQGGIDIIIVRSVSRFARNTVDCLEAVRMLKACGVGVIFEKEGINPAFSMMEMVSLTMKAITTASRIKLEPITTSRRQPTSTISRVTPFRQRPFQPTRLSKAPLVVFSLLWNTPATIRPVT